MWLSQASETGSCFALFHILKIIKNNQILHRCRKHFLSDKKLSIAYIHEQNRHRVYFL